MTIQHTPPVETVGLTKKYGESTVLDGLDLRVERGAVFALLGPNGAGKTTTVRLLATLTRPSAGTARVAGHDVLAERSRVRRAISLTGQFVALDDKQSGAENLRMMGRLRGLSRPAARQRTAELLERFDLTAAAHRRIETYSGGCAAGSTSQRGCWATPRSSSSTSRPPVSTRAAERSCGNLYGSCAAAAPPSS